jgi:hypothetical protein
MGGGPGRDPAHVARVIQWLDAGKDEEANFWRTVIRSPFKLRLRWDQMAEQVAARRKQREQGSNYGDTSAEAGVMALRKAQAIREQGQAS